MKRLGGALAVAVCSFFLTINSASASLVSFEFTLTKSLLNADTGESIGGPATPIVFDLTVDSTAPPGYVTTTSSLYFGNSGSVSVGTEMSAS